MKESELCLEWEGHHGVPVYSKGSLGLGVDLKL